MGGKKAAEEKDEEKKGGCLGKLLVLFVMVVLGGFLSALIFIALPQDTSDIGGYEGVLQAGEQRNLKHVLENSIKRGHPVTLTEKEINRYIRGTLAARQAGHLAPWAEIKGVAVRTHEGQVEVVIERLIAGRHPFTVSMFLTIEQEESPDGRISTIVNRHGGGYLEQLPQPRRGGRFGRVVVPQGFLLLVLHSFEQIAELYVEELDLALKEMARISVGKEGVVLDPRGSSSGFSLIE